MIEKTKECRRCHIVKPVSEFGIKRASKDGLDCYCKKCNAEKALLYRMKHSDRVKETAAKARERNREKIKQRNKKFYERTKNDPAHIEARKATVERNKEKWHKAERARREAFNRKWKHACEKCGDTRLYLIQFHHIDPATKEFCIGANATSRTADALEREVKKCVCLCSNCHDEFHYFYGGKPENPVEALTEYLSGIMPGNYAMEANNGKN